MGASGWSYFVPYQKDVKKAFIALRQREFNAGNYYKHEYSVDGPIENYFPPGHIITIEERMQTQKELDFLSNINKMPINTIDELLKKNGAEGTHSIIDIRDIEETDDLNSSGKLNNVEILKLYGTLRPTKEMVQSKEMELQQYRGRSLCTYQIVYLDELPEEYFFTGNSGD